MSTWFVSDKGKKSGPFPTSVVVQKVVANELSSGALVWKDGMQDWQPLLAHFKAPPSPAESCQLGILTEAQTPETTKTVTSALAGAVSSAKASQKRNFLRRFWQGQVSLPVSYWVVGVVGNFIVLVLLLLLQTALSKDEYDPTWIILSVAGSWLISVSWGVFHLVGIWRAAIQYRSEKRVQQKHGFWGGLAQVAVVIGAIGLVSSFAKIGAPQMLESFKIAFQDDPDTPPYTLRVMRNGTELEVAGGFKYGLASDFEKTLRALPQMQVVHLNSNGGRIGEAESLARIIRARGLSTYTSSKCLSACTIAFASGRERWLKENARLGYHGGKFAGQEHPEIMSNALYRAGYDDRFVKRAVSYPSTQMWYPTTEELKIAKVISGTSDAYRFAVSGYGIKPGTDDFAEVLRSYSVYRTIEQVAPRVFRQMADQFQRGYIQGLTEGVLLDQLRETYIAPLIKTALGRTDNPTSIEYAVLMADQLDALGSRDAKSCYEFAINGMTTATVNLLPSDLRNREIALNERALKAIHTGPVRSTFQLNQLYEKMAQRLVSRFGAENVALLDASPVPPPKYPAYCRVLAGMFREISRLPSAEAGDVMRNIFESSQAAKSPKK